MEGPGQTTPQLGGNQNNPAVNLPNDLLLTIFEINGTLYFPQSANSIFTPQLDCDDTDSSNSDTLLNLRNASHVCSTWRTALLESPLLWARAIELDHFFSVYNDDDDEDDEEEEGNSDDLKAALNKYEDSGPILWLKEVIRRTQASPLWVMGFVPMRPALKTLTLNLIKQEWHRIERIMVDMARCEI